MALRTFFIVAGLLLAQSCSADRGSYARLRSSYQTRLHTRGPAPARPTRPQLPQGVEALTYRSGGRRLRAWLVRPRRPTGKVPALVYLHGDLAFDEANFARIKPFVDRGILVFMPSYRGQQGNGGSLELLVGEVDDAAAAVRFVAGLPRVDPERIYAFGYSLGGGIAALLSLWEDLPLRETASVAGMYVEATFRRWQRQRGLRRLVRFDVNEPRELALRLLAPHLRAMAVPHVAYVGHEDGPFLRNTLALQARAAEVSAPFTMCLVGGDHRASLTHGIAAYAQRVRSQKSKE